jgi:hypothetical protein
VLGWAARTGRAQSNGGGPCALYDRPLALAGNAAVGVNDRRAGLDMTAVSHSRARAPANTAELYWGARRGLRPQSLGSRGRCSEAGRNAGWTVRATIAVAMPAAERFQLARLRETIGIGRVVFFWYSS